jgi:hypothetical protein
MVWGLTPTGELPWGYLSSPDPDPPGPDPDPPGPDPDPPDFQTITVLPVNHWNQFDEYGLLVGLKRLKGEKNWEYKRRILDVFVHLANSSYQGLVHGITRELNLSLFDALIINPKVIETNGPFLTNDPYISFDNSYLNLYSDYQNKVLDHQIDRFTKGGHFEHLNSLIEYINSTTNFEASVPSGTDLYTRSITILNQSNRRFISREIIPVSNKFQLKNKYLVKGSVFFSNRNIFHTEKNTVEEVLLPGNYHIDYTKGIVTAYQIPPNGIFVRYQYVQYPFTAVASPVILSDINKDSFKDQLFELILQANGSYIHGVATELGTDIINELYTVTPMYWGK